MNKSIFLCGLMGSGKSYFGKKIAEVLNLEFIDLDELIEKNESKSINTIFDEKGEAFFRVLELSTITGLLEKKQAIVIALGGGAVCFNNIDNMLHDQSNLIYLKSSPSEIYDRIKNETHRPLLKDKSKNEVIDTLNDLHDKRVKNYNKAHITIDVDKLDSVDVLAQMREFYEQRIR